MNSCGIFGCRHLHSAATQNAFRHDRTPLQSINFSCGRDRTAQITKCVIIDFIALWHGTFCIWEHWASDMDVGHGRLQLLEEAHWSYEPFLFLSLRKGPVKHFLEGFCAGTATGQGNSSGTMYSLSRRSGFAFLTVERIRCRPFLPRFAR